MKPTGGSQSSSFSVLGPWGQLYPQPSGVRVNASREAKARQCPESSRSYLLLAAPHHGAQL